VEDVERPDIETSSRVGNLTLVHKVLVEVEHILG